MSIIVKGTKQPKLIREEWVVDEAGRQTLEREYHGITSEIVGLKDTDVPLGATARTAQDGPVSSITIRYANPDNGGEEVAVDRWSVVTEVLDKDGFFQPDVHAEMEGHASPAAFRKGIEDAVNDGESVITVTTESSSSVLQEATYPNAYKLFRELRRGASHFETEYLVLRRQRTISPQWTGKYILNATSFIYDLGQLPVPNMVGWTLPGTAGNPLPSNPAQAYWGYRLRTQQTDFIGNRVEQVHEWVLAAWSTFYYQKSTSNFPG